MMNSISILGLVFYKYPFIGYGSWIEGKDLRSLECH